LGVQVPRALQRRTQHDSSTDEQKQQLGRLVDDDQVVGRGEVTRVSDSKAVRGSRDSRTEKRTSIPTFYRQVVAELRKVVYPTQEQLVTYFLVVMVFVIFMMALVSALDLGFGKLVFAVFAGN
jgi:preprotein translocase subunit SecE